MLQLASLRLAGNVERIPFGFMDVRFAMSFDDASSTVTYTSVSSGSSEPSAWGIPLMNAGEIPNMDPYKESTMTRQRRTCRSRISLMLRTLTHGFLADSDPMEDDTDAGSIDYLDEPEDDDEDLEEDPSKEHESDNEEAKKDEPFEDSDETEPSEEHETAATPSKDNSMIRMKDDIPKEDMAPRGRFVLTAPPPGCDIAESFAAAAARASRGQYDFVDGVGTGQGLVRSPGHEAWTIARAADRAEDVGYARALQASKHRMMTSIEEVNLRTDRRDIRLEIDVVRGQRTAYETELQEVRWAYLKSEAQNRALLARLETLETHMTRMEWQRQRAKDDAVRQIMRTHVLEARARIDTVE
ncbi:hypothetical protein Tco_0555421, partial [Tanacetum coccineum]